MEYHFSCRVSFNQEDYPFVIDLLSELGLTTFEEGETIVNSDGDLELVKEYSLVTLRFVELDQLYIAKHLIEKNINSAAVILTGKNSNYLDEWKKFAKPIEITKEITIWPSWLNPPSASNVVILDPGYAFGSGSHETTTLCARELTKLQTTGSLIDVGCGSGILSIIAAKVGFKNIQGIDIDPFAVEAAKINAEKNKITSIDFSDRTLAEITEQYDVVVANIISGVLLQNREHLLRLLKSDGRLVLSGILNSELALVVEKFGLKQIFSDSLGEWSVLVLVKV